MKKQKSRLALLLMFSFLLSFLLFSCKKMGEPEASPSENDIAAFSIPEIVQASLADKTAEEQRVKQLFLSLEAAQIDKIVFEQVTPSDHGIYESDSKNVIAAWVNLLNAMDISGEQFDFIFGVGVSIAVYIGKEKIALGCFIGDYITSAGTKTMCKISNYAELHDEMVRAKAMVSKSLR